MLGRISGRVLPIVIALALTTSAGRAQPAFAPERCAASKSESLPALEARRESLQRDVANTPPSNSQPGAQTGSKKAQQKLRESQEQLLEVLFKIDCLRITPQEVASAERQEPRQRRWRGPTVAAPKPTPALEVTTFYATNRTPTGNAGPAKFYGAGIGRTFRYGRAVVTIPPGHIPGNLELPTLWKFERQADPSKHFVLKAVQPLSAEAARKEMAEKLQSMASQSLLLFVHGYNTSFEDAALRTAQLAHDLEFPGMALFFSWPSAGKALAYWQDEEASQLSEVVFEELLGELSRLPVKDIYVVAHSMGNRIVTGALRSRVEKKEKTDHIRELLLAAPDINAELFRTTIAPKLAGMQGTQTTIYAASSDLALRASKVVHGFKRVGETVGGVFVYPGFDTIDASSAATAIRGFGHSYLMDSSPVLKDLKTIVLQKLAARQRGLSEMGTSPDLYWQLR
jgi:esterase/lipase superfamily enzyme